MPTPNGRFARLGSIASGCLLAAWLLGCSAELSAPPRDYPDAEAASQGRDQGPEPESVVDIPESGDVAPEGVANSPARLEPLAPGSSPRLRRPAPLTIPRLEEFQPRTAPEAVPDRGRSVSPMVVDDRPEPRRRDMPKSLTPHEAPDAAPPPAPRIAAVEEPSPEAEAGSEPRAPLDVAKAEPRRVTVFYGTNRNRTRISDQASLGPLTPWFLGGAGILVGLQLGFLAGWRLPSVLRVAVVSLAGFASVVGAGKLIVALTPAERVGYGNDLAELEVGTCDVSIPPGHVIGEIERPEVVHWEFREDAGKHVVIRSVGPLPFEEFRLSLADRIASSPDRDAFVFVHGYNVTFDDAARRTAQMADDLEFPGAPTFFSWPAQGELFAYFVDEEHAAASVEPLRRFLEVVAYDTGAERVHLIAHSMGNRPLTAALTQFRREGGPTAPVFHEIVLTAPDLDARVFREEIVPAIVGVGRRVTLYASSNDLALLASARVHGNDRLGLAGPNLSVLEGVETIDVSEIDTSLLGHDYYGHNGSVLADLFHVLHGSTPIRERRWLREGQRSGRPFWVFEAGRIDLAAHRSARRY